MKGLNIEDQGMKGLNIEDQGMKGLNIEDQDMKGLNIGNQGMKGLNIEHQAMKGLIWKITSYLSEYLPTGCWRVSSVCGSHSYAVMLCKKLWHIFRKGFE